MIVDDADKINATPQPELGEEEEMDIVPPKSRSKAVRKPCLTPDERWVWIVNWLYSNLFTYLLQRVGNGRHSKCLL